MGRSRIPGRLAEVPRSHAGWHLQAGYTGRRKGGKVTFDEYERSQRDLYRALAETSAAILEAAIAFDGGYRLQQVASRAKDSTSLRRKMEKEGIDPSSDIENRVKD